MLPTSLPSFADHHRLVLIVTVAVGVQDRPASAPQIGPFTPDVKIVGAPDFAQAMSAVATIIFAFSGTPAFFPIASEMKEPKHYARSMLICQATVFTVYLVVGVVVYYFCGSYVASPALGSAGTLMKKVCYGIALPGLLVTEMITCHVSLTTISPLKVNNTNVSIESCRPNTSSFVSCEDLGISPQTLSHIGSLGCRVPLLSSSSHTLSPAQSPTSAVWSHSSVLC